MTFDDFKNEVMARSKDYADRMSEFYECPVSSNWESMTAGAYQVFRLTCKPQRGEKEVFVYIFDSETGCFIKGRVTKKGFRINKTQPKKPITLDNYEFNNEGMGIKRIHAAEKGWFKVVGCTHIDSAA